MSTVTSTLTIAGSTVNRAAERITLQRLLYGIQGVETLDFCQEVAGSVQGSYSQGQAVSLSMTDGTTTATVFVGQIVSTVVTGMGQGVISVGYHCLGMRYLANQIFTTDPAGTGRIVYNLPNNDPNWSPNLSALSVGSILSDYFGQHSTQLTALGVSQPPDADLEALTIVPTDPVVMSGRIMDMVDALMAQWGCNKYQCYIDPDTLTIRVVDTTALPAATLTFGADPIQLPSFSADKTNCYTQVVLRGGGETTAAVLSLSSGTLVGEASSGGGWTPAQQASWTIDVFLYPSNSVQGAITSMTTLSVTCDSFTGPVTTWDTNYWNQGQIWVQYGFGSGYGGTTASYQQQQTAEVVSCTATSSGSATFVVDVPFSAVNYTTVEVHGPPLPEALVYRKYTIPNTLQRASDGAQLNLHLTQYLMGSVPWSPTDGVVVQATGPSGVIYYGGQGISATFQIYPTPDGTTPGYIVFDQPTVQWFSSQASLKSGSPDGVPTDIKVLVPYSNGALSATAPSGGGYSGTAYTQYGIKQTLYRDYPNWVSPALGTNMGTLAQLILETVQDVVIEGTCVYSGVPVSLLTLGQSLNLEGGLAEASLLASMACCIRNITVEWPDHGGTYQVTQLMFNNQRKAFTGDSLFLHPLATRATQQPGEWTLAVPPPRYAGVSGPVLGELDRPGGEVGEGEPGGVSADSYGGSGGSQAPPRPARRPRLLSREMRDQASAAHATRDLQARQQSEEAAARHDAERPDRINPDAELMASERAARDDERQSRERLVRKDNARRAGVMRRDPVAHREVPRGPIELRPEDRAPEPSPGLPDPGLTMLPDPSTEVAGG